jgi:heme/copper-type cytochrome/quinol oxidase subunit 2
VGVHDRTRESRPAWWLAMALLAGVVLAAGLVAQSKRDVSVSARKYTFVVSDSNSAEIRVQQDDLVNVVFTAEDIAHSFTISDDHYRIDRRAEPGKPASFRFRADKPGQFEIRCTLTIDDRCARDMRARLVVVGK